MSRQKPNAILLALLLLLLPTGNACSARNAESAGAPKPHSAERPAPEAVGTGKAETARISTKADIAQLLSDSFVIGPNDHRYFVDDAWSTARSPFSLYETYWQLKWRNGELPEGMNRDRLRPWVRAAVSPGLGSSQLQKVAQVALAAGISTHVDGAASPEAVRASLEQLRDGYLFSPDPGVKGSWGSTSAAVRALQDVRLPAPEGTRKEARVALTQLPQRLTPEEAVNTAIPLLEIYVATRDEVESASDARRVWTAAEGSLNTIAAPNLDVAWLGAKYQLRQLASALGYRHFPGLAFCDQLVKSGGFVTAPGRGGADIQGTFYARELGCRNVVKQLERPYTRAGWLIGKANDPYETLGATRAAMAIEAVMNGGKRSEAAVGSTMRDLWIPMLKDPSLSSTARSVVAARLQEVSTAAGLPLKWPSVDLDAGETDLFSLLVAISVGDRRLATLAEGVVEKLTRDPSSNSIEIAAALNLASRYAPNEAAKSRVMAIAELNRIATGIYSLEPCDRNAGCRKPSASIAASAMGSWIDGLKQAPRRQWERSGLCRGFVCADNEQDGLSLAQMYIAVICDVPRCGDRTPFLI